MQEDPEIQNLLAKVRLGDTGARDALISRIYPELKRAARMLMAGERKSHTLGQTGTGLVSMYWMRLQTAHANSLESIEDLDHLLKFSIRNMRQILVDYSRRYGVRRAHPSGRNDEEVLNRVGVEEKSLQPDIVDLDEALTKLEEIDPERAKPIEYKYFGGLTIEEGAAALNIPQIKYRRQCDYAEAWIKNYLTSRPDPETGG